jgi:hypothetical protein
MEKCICGCEMIEVDSHLICSQYYKNIKKMIEMVKERLEIEA